MSAHSLDIQIDAANVTIEITDGHGSWSIGQQQIVEHIANDSSANSVVTITPKTEANGPIIVSQNIKDYKTNINTHIVLSVETSLDTVSLRISLFAGNLVLVNSGYDSFADKATGTHDYVLKLK